MTLRKADADPIGQFGLALSGARGTYDVDFSNDPMMKVVFQQQSEYVKYVVPDLSTPFMSDTYTAKGGELNKLINDAVIKFIMGLINENEWNQVIKQWNDLGGNKVIEEYSAEYARSLED